MPALNGVRPFQFQSFDEPLTIEDVVFQAIGAASVCWEDVGRAGPFDPDLASEVAEAFLAFVRGHIAELLASGEPAFTGTLEDLWRDLAVARAPVLPLSAHVALYELP
jgi:hypothetical protein